jgi:hypothetical protein
VNCLAHIWWNPLASGRMTVTEHRRELYGCLIKAGTLFSSGDYEGPQWLVVGRHAEAWILTLPEFSPLPATQNGALVRATMGADDTYGEFHLGSLGRWQVYSRSDGIVPPDECRLCNWANHAVIDCRPG